MVQPPIGEQPEQPWRDRERRPVKRRNGFANAGIVLAVLVSILSLIISINGLDKLKTLADAGKALSIAGSGTTVPARGGTTMPPINLPLPSSIGTAVDPGSITAASVGRDVTDTLNADRAALSRDQDNPPAQLADLQRLVTDLQSLQRQMTTAEAQATHPSVKTGISAMISDLSTFSSGLQAVENGDLSQVNQMATVADKVKSDGRTIATTCTSVSPSRANG